MNEPRDEKLKREAAQDQVSNIENPVDLTLTTPPAVEELLDEELEAVTAALNKNKPGYPVNQPLFGPPGRTD
jgi:hypothetical protein